MAFSAPVANADRIVVITLDGNGINGKYSRTRSDMLLDLLSIWCKVGTLADGLTPFSWGPGTILLANRDLPIATARVGPDFFHTVGISAARGRVFAPEDARDCRCLRGAQSLALAA